MRRGVERCAEHGRVCGVRTPRSFHLEIQPRPEVEAPWDGPKRLNRVRPADEQSLAASLPKLYGVSAGIMSKTSVPAAVASIPIPGQVFVCRAKIEANNKLARLLFRQCSTMKLTMDYDIQL